MTKEEVGDKLKNFRLHRGKKVLQVAKSAGISRVTLYRIERGGQMPSVDVYNRIVNAINQD